jgi:hypothetical protein
MSSTPDNVHRMPMNDTSVRAEFNTKSELDCHFGSMLGVFGNPLVGIIDLATDKIEMVMPCLGQPLIH